MENTHFLGLKTVRLFCLSVRNCFIISKCSSVIWYEYEYQVFDFYQKFW